MLGGGFMESLTAGEEDDDQDAMKEALLETSPAFLAFTAIATLLHTVFEMLAFKNGWLLTILQLINNNTL